MFKEFEYINPVHEKNKKWYFWNETWSDAHGPYLTEAIADEQCSLYGQSLNRSLTAKEKARIISPKYLDMLFNNDG